jgi:hypothetical protein
MSQGLGVANGRNLATTRLACVVIVRADASNHSAKLPGLVPPERPPEQLTPPPMLHPAGQMDHRLFV